MKSFIFLVVALLMGTVVAQSQTPTPTVLLQDSLLVSLVRGNGDTTAATNWWSAYDFSTRYDSTNVEFKVTEMKVNGNRIDFDNWIDEQEIRDVDADSLSKLSKSEVFTVSAGDTVSVYRELSWGACTECNMGSAYAFHSLDTIGLRIRLTSISGSTTYATIDSIVVLPDTGYGAPQVYGTSSSMATIKFIIPSGFSNAAMRIRFDLRQDGAGDYYFKRTCNINGRLSKKIDSAAYSAYYSQFNFASNTPKEVPNNTWTPPASAPSILISPNPVLENGNVMIRVSDDDNPEITRSIAVFNTNGTLVHQWTWGVGQPMPGYVVYAPQTSGTYFVGYYVDGIPKSYAQATFQR